MADLPPHNLPVALSSFIGRERELADVQRLLTSSRLVTLTGVGGVGKTRVALQVAADQIPAHPDGVWLIELASHHDGASVPLTVLTTLGLHEQAGVLPMTTLMQALRLHDALLVLDNCEHLGDACARLSDTLLRACPLLRILATSREPLGVNGEVLYPVPPLGVPEPTATTLDALTMLESVQLFQARAHAANPSFRLTAANAEALATICHQLEGIPLALELAAARTKAMTLHEIALRLDDELGLLKGGGRTTATRHQTMRATLDWSHDLLSEPEQVLFRRLAVFVGGWTLAAAEAVCAGEGVGRADVIDLLTALVEKSLVVAGTQAGETRYRMLEPVRQYAVERMNAQAESGMLRERHLDFFVSFAEAEEASHFGPDYWRAVERFRPDYENVRHALRWAMQADTGVERGLRLMGAAHSSLFVMPNLVEHTAWLENLLSRNVVVSPIYRAKALLTITHYCVVLSHFNKAQTYAEEALQLAQSMGDRRSEEYALAATGASHLNLGRLAQAEEYGRRGYMICAAIGDRYGMTDAIMTQGLALYWSRDFKRADEVLAEGVALCKEVGGLNTLPFLTMLHGDVAESLGDLGLAKTRYNESLQYSLRDRFRWNQGQCFLGLGRVALREGNYADAAEQLRLAFEAFRETVGYNFMTVRMMRLRAFCAFAAGDVAQSAVFCKEAIGMATDALSPWLYSTLSATIGLLALARGDSERAVRLWGKGDPAARNEHPLSVSEREAYESALTQVSSKLGRARFDALWNDGANTTLDQAIAEAKIVLNAEFAPKTAVSHAGATDINSAGLTVREIEVLRWLARGLSDAEIAEQLVLSVRTINSHLRSIYSKLDVTTRTAAVHSALEMKLV